MLLVCINHINCGKKIANLPVKASMRSLEKMVNKSAKVFYCAFYTSQNRLSKSRKFMESRLLRPKIHHNWKGIWDVPIWNPSHSSIIESVEGRTDINWYNDTIIKIVLFICIAGFIIVVMIQMRKIIYLERVKSLISSLAILKHKLKTKIDITDVHQDASRIQKRRENMRQ